jgi:hypothetical protein
MRRVLTNVILESNLVAQKTYTFRLFYALARHLLSRAVRITELQSYWFEQFDARGLTGTYWFSRLCCIMLDKVSNL